MIKTVVSLSIDDGRADTYSKAYPVLKKYGLTATVHIATGFIDGSIKNTGWKSCNKAMSAEQVLDMHRNGFEISSHGDMHITEKQDFLNSLEKFREWGIDNENFGFSVPNSMITDSEKITFGNFLKEINAPYMRVGRHKNCYTLISKMCYILYKYTGIQFFYNMFNKHNLNTGTDPYSIYSVVVKDDDRVENILKFIEKYNKNARIVLMLHSVLAKTDEGYGKDSWYFDEDKFELLCSGLKKMADKGVIEIKTIQEIV